MPIRDEKPKRRRVEEDEEESTPRSRRRNVESEDDEDERPSKREPVKKTGWAALTAKKKEVEVLKEARENEVPEFYLTEKNDTAVVQFLNDEPEVVDGHSIRTGPRGKERFLFTPCQLNTQRKCAMCSAGITITTKFAFKVLDMRGTYDKDKDRFKKDKPLEKLWYMGMKMAEQAKSIADKKNKEITDIVYEVSRSGSQKTTSYNFSMALDEDDKRIPLTAWKEQFPSIAKITKPLTDEQLEIMGFAPAND